MEIEMFKADRSRFWKSIRDDLFIFIAIWILFVFGYNDLPRFLLWPAWLVVLAIFFYAADRVINDSLAFYITIEISDKKLKIIRPGSVKELKWELMQRVRYKETSYWVEKGRAEVIIEFEYCSHFITLKMKTFKAEDEEKLLGLIFLKAMEYCIPIIKRITD